MQLLSGEVGLGVYSSNAHAASGIHRLTVRFVNLIVTSYSGFVSLLFLCHEE